MTGAAGFVGKNLIAELRNRNYGDLYEFDIDTEPNLLDEYTRKCEFVFHLAGINRPKDELEFVKGNVDFTSQLISLLKKHNNPVPILATSSIQAALDTPYGQSKLAGEALLFSYQKENNVPVFLYRMPNVFGKWCRPNYNSAVATFCYNIARGMPITVNDPSVQMQLVYIDDVIKEFLDALEGHPNKKEQYCEISTIHRVTLGEITDLLYEFCKSRKTLFVPNVNNLFEKALYSTYLSYLPEDSFSYPLKMNEDQRGSFTEFVRTRGQGQFSVNISKPGITKGNHWHHTKNEKFLVVRGSGIVRFRNIYSERVIEYPVSGENMNVIDIPVGYTHNITNTGDGDMVTIMWANEVFDPDQPDTFFLPV